MKRYLVRCTNYVEVEADDVEHAITIGRWQIDNGEAQFKVTDEQAVEIDGALIETSKEHARELFNKLVRAAVKRAGLK